MRCPRISWLMPGIFLVLLANSVSAQNSPNALLSEPETDSTATRILQLMESTATAVPGLVRASDPLRQNTQATAAELSKSLRDSSLTLQLANELRAYLAIADSLPRPDFFPSAASQQFLELRDELQKLDRHFQALLIAEKADTQAGNADPGNLKRYAATNSKTPPPSPSVPRYVFLGDSATDLWRLNEYFTGKDFINRGIASQTTGQILSRFLADVVSLRPLAVVVLAGSNDIASGIPVAAIADNLTMMADVAKAHSIQPVFASVLPAGGEAAKTRPAATVQQLNNWIRDYCSRQNFIYIDYYSAMADNNGMLKADLSDDGLTPNAKGYRVMSPILLDGLQRLQNAIAAHEDPAKAKHRSFPLFSK